MSTSSSLPSASTIALLTIGTLTTGILAYAVYFDHKRQTDPEFRKQLKRDSKRTAKAAKEAEVAGEKQMRQRVLDALEQVKNEELPTDAEDVEQFFMQEVAKGEQLGSDDPLEAALCFYRALKVYPQPRELITIYDKTVPKPVLDILAQMIANDPSIPGKSGNASRAGSDDGVTVE